MTHVCTRRPAILLYVCFDDSYHTHTGRSPFLVAHFCAGRPTILRLGSCVSMMYITHTHGTLRRLAIPSVRSQDIEA